MASQLVLDEIQKLHKELDRMQPALRQVEIAEELIREAKIIPENFLKLTTLMEQQEARFKQQLITELNQQADGIHREVETVVKSADTIVARLIEHDKELNKLKATIEPLADQLAAIQLKDRLVKIETISDQTAGQVGDQSDRIQTGLKDLEEQFKTLHQDITDYTQQVRTDIGQMTKQTLNQLEDVHAKLNLVQQQQASQKTFYLYYLGPLIAVAHKPLLCSYHRLNKSWSYFFIW